MPKFIKLVTLTLLFLLDLTLFIFDRILLLFDTVLEFLSLFLLLNLETVHGFLEVSPILLNVLDLSLLLTELCLGPVQLLVLVTQPVDLGLQLIRLLLLNHLCIPLSDLLDFGKA